MDGCGTPTRCGNVSAQLKLFLALANELRQQGKLIDKIANPFTSSQTEHGGQESTIDGADEETLVVARAQGARSHASPG